MEERLEEDGFVLERLSNGNREWKHLTRLLSATDATTLGKGKDVQKAFGVYNNLRVAHAWRIKHTINQQRYELERRKIQGQMEKLSKQNIPLPGVRSLPTRTAAVGERLFDDGLISGANEVLLLHGTTPETLLSLLTNGFNQNYSGSNSGSAFGDGVYLAEDIGKTDQYSRVDPRIHLTVDKDLYELHERLYGKEYRHPGNVFYVLVCRASLGAPIRTRTSTRHAKSIDTHEDVFPTTGGGSKNFRELRQVPGVTPPFNHHSLIAELGESIVRYREFVTFHGEYVLPVYLVAYQRFHDSDLVLGV